MKKSMNKGLVEGSYSILMPVQVPQSEYGSKQVLRTTIDRGWKHLIQTINRKRVYPMKRRDSTDLGWEVFLLLQFATHGAVIHERAIRLLQVKQERQFPIHTGSTSRSYRGVGLARAVPWKYGKASPTRLWMRLLPCLCPTLILWRKNWMIVVNAFADWLLMLNTSSE